MPSRNVLICLLASLLPAFTAPAVAELNILFTTPQERQLINANRYKNDEAKSQPVVEQEPDAPPIQQPEREEVSVDYRISGISLSGDGVHTVWINGQSYLDGEQLEDRSRLKVLAGDEIRVRITTPDGKHYYGTSGETLSVSYMAAIEN